MITIPTYSEAFAANGGVGGAIQVGNSRNYWPGAKAYISGTGLPGVTVIILALVDATHIRVGLHPDEGVITNSSCRQVAGSTPPDLSAYTTALSAKIDVPSQTVWMMPDGGVIPKLPTIWTS